MDNNGWISVKERLPQYMDYVLITDGYNIWMGEYDRRPHKREWGVVYNGAPPFESDAITHWQALPSPPKE